MTIKNHQQVEKKMVEQIQDLRESLEIENHLETSGLEFIDDYDDIIMSENKLVMTTRRTRSNYNDADP